METLSKATRDLALSDDVNPSAEFPAQMGESTPASGDLGYMGAAGIAGTVAPPALDHQPKLFHPICPFMRAMLMGHHCCSVQT